MAGENSYGEVAGLMIWKILKKWHYLERWQIALENLHYILCSMKRIVTRVAIKLKTTMTQYCEYGAQLYYSQYDPL